MPDVTIGSFEVDLSGGCEGCCCDPCPCLGDTVGSLCFTVSSTPPEHASLGGAQTIDPSFPTDGEGHATNCEWDGPAEEGTGAKWRQFWDCDHWSLQAPGASYTCAAGDFDCSTGGTFAGGGDGWPATIVVGPC